MGKADRFTEDELDFLRSSYPRLGPSETARRMGRSLSAVKRNAKKLGLSAADRAPRKSALKRPGSTVGQLEELRDSLREAMADAPPNAIASISRELRAVMRDLDEIEAREAGEESNPLEEIAKAIADGLRA